MAKLTRPSILEKSEEVTWDDIRTSKFNPNRRRLWIIALMLALLTSTGFVVLTEQTLPEPQELQEQAVTQAHKKKRLAVKAFTLCDRLHQWSSVTVLQLAEKTRHSCQAAGRQAELQKP